MLDDIKVLRLLVRFFERHNIRYCLAGGTAVIYYGVIRNTDDLDFFIALDACTITEVFAKMQLELPVVYWSSNCSMLTVHIASLRVDLLPYGSLEEKRALYNAKYRNIYGVRCKVAQLEDLLLLKLSIASTEERHANDVVLICNRCRGDIKLKYLKEGIKALKLEKHTEYLGKLLKTNV